MYIAIYDENKNHITNIDNATYELTERVYDADSFSTTGKCDIDINAAKLLVLNDEAGNYIYAALVDSVSPENNTRTIKGLDFKTLLDTEVLIDYTPVGSFDGKLSAIFAKVTALIVNSPDVAVKTIPVIIELPTDDTDTTSTFGTLQGTYKITNAYAFLKCYLKFYEYNVQTIYDVAAGVIKLSFVKCAERIAIGLNDFIYNLQTTSDATNKTVATITYSPEKAKEEKDADGNVIPSPPPDPRPESWDTNSTVYYYRNKDNGIVQSDKVGDITGRLYPVRCKMFEAEYLADAQFDAVNELANARYVDNVILDHNKIIDPIDLSSLRLYTKLDLYHDGKFYKTLPVSEKITTADADGINIKIKLGFKKILLTEIIKG